MRVCACLRWRVFNSSCCLDLLRRRFSLQERQQLAKRISALEDARLRFILKLVRSLEPRKVQTAGDEYEFDIAQLGPPTIRAVIAQLDVWDRKARRASGQSQSSGKPAGGTPPNVGRSASAVSAGTVAAEAAASAAVADAAAALHTVPELPRRGRKRGLDKSVKFGAAGGAGGSTDISDGQDAGAGEGFGIGDLPLVPPPGPAPMSGMSTFSFGSLGSLPTFSSSYNMWWRLDWKCLTATAACDCCAVRQVG